jgi:hypothetical protein
MCRSITRITSAPNTPGAITGPLSLCPNNSAGYSVVQVNNATAYIWTTTGGLSVTGGAGTNAVTIQAPAGFITGTISVRSSNCIGQSGMRTITVKGVPSTPIWKTTPPTVTCGGGCYVFNIDNVQDAVSWTYTAPAGCVITSTGAPGSGNPLTTTKSKATICFPAGFVSGTVSIRSNNACGQSAAITWAVSSIPAQPGAITGAGTVCRSQSNVQYSIVAVPTATSYAWTITGNAQITNGQGTNSIRVRFVNSNANNVTLSVRAVNACGQSPVRTRSINVNQNCRVTEEAGEITQSASTDILMNAYPNPTTGKVMITFNSEENIRYKLNVTDLMGKVVISDEIISIQDQNMYEINLENEAKGLYILSLRREDGEVMSLKLILK